MDNVSEINSNTGICSFSDYIKKLCSGKCLSLIRLCLQHGKIEPVHHSAASHIYAESAEIRNVYASRTDSSTLRTDIIIEAGFYIISISGYKYRKKVWYRVQGKFYTDKKPDLFELISLYKKEDIPSEGALSESLIPYLSKKELESEANKLLEKYCPEVLRSPLRLSAETLAERMNLKVIRTELSDNSAVLGRLFIKDSCTVCYKNGRPYKKEVKAGTILIDMQAHLNRKYDPDDTIIHECIHIYEHCLFYALHCLMNSSPAEHAPEFEDIVCGRNEDDPVRWAELQAYHMLHRIKMPLEPAAFKAAELFEKHKKLKGPEAKKNVISDLAEFYNVSFSAAENRLNEIGYERIDSITEMIYAG